MKFSAVLVVAALCLGRCRTIAAAALPQRDYPFSDDAGTPPPQPTGRSNGLRWREKGLVTVIVGGTLLHVVRILGKNRVIRELQGLLENNQLRTDEKLKSSRAAYKKALSESNKDRSFKSSSHTINLDMAQDRLMMKCILEKLGLAEVVFDETRVHINPFNDAMGTCAERRGYLPSQQQQFYLDSSQGDWVVLEPDLYTPHPEMEGGFLLPLRRPRPTNPPQANGEGGPTDGGKPLASHLTPANIAKHGAERLFGTRPAHVPPIAAGPKGALGHAKLTAPRLGWR